MLHLPQNLKLIRLLSGKTQTEFGEPLNATKAMIVSYEKGKASPDRLFIDRVCKMAGITEDQLLNKPLKEENVNFEKVEKLESEGSEPKINAATSSEEKVWKQVILNLSESTNRHSIIDERNSRTLEKLVSMIAIKWGLDINEGPELPEIGDDNVVDIRERAKKTGHKK